MVKERVMEGKALLNPLERNMLYFVCCDAGSWSHLQALNPHIVKLKKRRVW